MKKTILLLVVFFAVSFAAQSQNMNRPWLIGVSTNYANFHSVDMPLSDQITDDNWMGNTVVSQLKIGRMLSKDFVLSAEVSMIKLDKNKLNKWSHIESPITNNDFWRIQGQFQYKFANGYLLKEDCRFDPYIFLGANGSKINEKTYLAQSTGIGINIWLTNWLGVNAEGSYDYVFDWNDYFHSSVGLVARFGKKSDKDKDGIADKKDACPDVAGIIELSGCPDTDKDGITDKEDKCPTIAGLKATQGCPDRDNDGISDMDDRCPDTPGPAELKGCPDRDKDGVPDMDDRCPDFYGQKESNGCPDRDKDGVSDMDDRCPDIYGPVELKGCPDSDKDGVADIEDACPEQPGVVALQGCPDTDGDGVSDKDDRCPNEKGPKTNNGCPLIEIIKVKQIEKTMQSYADRIEFVTGKYVIKSASNKKLDNIVKIMQEYPNSVFAIEGHTDYVGSDSYNQILSENRAYAVRQYFVDKGIDPNRLTFVGYGETRPRDTNATPEGRAKNRRVEIHFVQ
jgi:outer membrane protein OmpA-like peptidoglycan-associated protein